MRALLLSVLFCHFVSPVFANTELLESTVMGPTHVDPISMTTYLNYRGKYDPPQVSYANCKLDSNNKPIENYFILKVKDDKGVVQEDYRVDFGSSCEKIAELNEYKDRLVDCAAHSALEMSISDPKECVQGKCTQHSTPQVFSKPLDINLSPKKLQEEIAKCSPEDQFLIIKDKISGKNLVASLADKSHCTLEKRRIITPGALWDDGSSQLTHIYSSNPESGFTIGDHTKYFYEKGKGWCLTFRPDLGIAKKTCGYDGMTRSLAFSIPGVDKKFQKGVVQLSVENGVPIARIGHPMSQHYSKTPQLNPNAPLLKVSLLNKEGEGRRTIFESMTKDKGDVTRKITVAPTYSIGASIGKAGSCDTNACLNTAQEVLATNSPLHCAKTDATPFQNAKNSKETCYSCNGVSSGNCGTKKVILNKDTIESYKQKMSSCKSQKITPTSSESEAESKDIVQ